jgi:hypothetical protein
VPSLYAAAAAALVGEAVAVGIAVAVAVAVAEAPTTGTDVLGAGCGVTGVARLGVRMADVKVVAEVELARPASAERVSRKPAAYTLAMADALSATIPRGGRFVGMDGPYAAKLGARLDAPRA